MWGVHDGMGWWMLFGSIWFIVFWGAVIYFAFWAVSRITRDQRREDTPLEILKRRYARGEISREEFEQMRREIG
jgi:putative membrane protein